MGMVAIGLGVMLVMAVIVILDKLITKWEASERKAQQARMNQVVRRSIERRDESWKE